MTVALPEGPIDWSRVGEICGDRRERMLGLLALFLEDAQSELAALERARTAKDLSQMAELAHRVRGSAQLMGINTMTELAGSLEQAGRRGAAEQADTLVTELVAALAALREFIQPLLAGTSAAQ